MNSIINLDLLLTIALGYIGFMSEKFEERAYVMQLIEMFISSCFMLLQMAYFTHLTGAKRVFMKCLEKNKTLFSCLGLKILVLGGGEKWGNSKIKLA